MPLHVWNRILSVDLRALGFGFVVFEGTDLIDHGARHYEGSEAERLFLLRRRLVALLQVFTPELVVVRVPFGRHSAPLRKAIAVIKQELRQRSIRFQLMKGEYVSRYYLRRYGVANKHAVATLIAARINELQPLVPPKRKAWQSEHPRSTVLDAAAAGICLLGMDRFEPRSPQLS